MSRTTTTTHQHQHQQQQPHNHNTTTTQQQHHNNATTTQQQRNNNATTTQQQRNNNATTRNNTQQHANKNTNTVIDQTSGSNGKTSGGGDNTFNKLVPARHTQQEGQTETYNLSLLPPFPQRRHKAVSKAGSCTAVSTAEPRELCLTPQCQQRSSRVSRRRVDSGVDQRDASGGMQTLERGFHVKNTVLFCKARRLVHDFLHVAETMTMTMTHSEKSHIRRMKA